MFKKLQNLLFEDEEVDEEDIDEEEEEEPRKPKKAVRNEEVKQEPAVQEPVKVAEPQLHRIDVTQPLPKVEQAVKPAAPAVDPFRQTSTIQHASPRPIQADDVKTPELPKSTFGIKADAAPAPVKKQAPAKEKKPRKATYEFKPVISPMFGVDEKDLDAMQTSAKNAFLSDDKDDENVSKIISPIYGVSDDAKPTPIASTVEKSNEMEEMTYNKEARKSEDELPDFSLDDILNARDEEFAREAANEAAPKEGEDIDETVVIDSKHLQPFGKVESREEKASK